METYTLVSAFYGHTFPKLSWEGFVIGLRGLVTHLRYPGQGGCLCFLFICT